MAHAIAAAIDKVTHSMVKVTSLKVGAAGRRLSVIARRLAATVVVEYKITFPAGETAPTLTKASINEAKLKDEIKSRAKAQAGLTITVSDVTVQPIVLTSAGGSTKAPTTSTTGTETSPSVRHFLSIGIMMVAMMSLMHSR